MKVNVNSSILFILLIIAQLIMTNYFHLSQFISLSLLPAMILCVPMSIPTVLVMIIAFATGLSVDIFAEGVLGLNAFCLIPVALARNSIVGLVIGNEVVIRGGEFSFRKNGAAKVSLAILMSVALFVLVYVIVDGAGTRGFWFNSARFVASTLCNFVLGVIAVRVLNAQDHF